VCQLENLKKNKNFLKNLRIDKELLGKTFDPTNLLPKKFLKIISEIKPINILFIQLFKFLR